MRERRAHIARAQNQLQRRTRHAGLMQQADGVMRNQARLLSGLGNHGIACHQGRHGLADKNRQGEIPRADGHHRAQRLRIGSQGLLGFLGVVAAKIHRFADFGTGIGQGFARFAQRQHHQYRLLRLH